jgi:hypothetical protein
MFALNETQPLSFLHIKQISVPVSFTHAGNESRDIQRHAKGGVVSLL